MKYLHYVLIVLLSIIFISCGDKAGFNKIHADFQEHFEGDAQIEVGGPFVGIEFHHSFPMPQRISFFYPSANSLDLSKDYWKRDSTFVMSAGIRVGYGGKSWIGTKPYKFTSTPYSATFTRTDTQKTISISYRFCKDKPAAVVTYEITNNSNDTKPFELYTHLEASIKTSHTYDLIDKASTSYDPEHSAVFVKYDDPRTQNAELFVANAGLNPEGFNTAGNLHNKPYNGDWWYRNYAPLPGITYKSEKGVPAASFLYKEKLKSGGKMVVVQIIGTCKDSEGVKEVKYLADNYKKEIKSYEDYVLASIDSSKFATGDSVIDKSFKWAKGILASNRHYIDGSIVPMPCPAEYNFYFTHDVLVTDYAAVNYDLPRVKQDLLFIKYHSKDNIIPHAYYWKDGAYKTEYASSDNWNNFWFIIVSASYLRHSGDTATIQEIYPLLKKCLEQTFTNKKDDDLMWEDHLDGSDLGSSYGPRAFMTSLAIKSIRDFIYIKSILGSNNELKNYENLADRMEKALNEKLWNDKLGYLINYYKGGKLDTHFYTGALIAPHFGLLDKERTDKLVSSAVYYLLDPKIGIYSIYPMDLDKLKGFLNLKGDEAGMPYYYANGGIWAHANAWFALALEADGRSNEALNFVKKTMTLNGIINSPNGQPAMYEYRVSDKNNPEVYGKIDKPQFLWAAGWYTYCLYHIYGIDENSWNVRFNPFLPDSEKSVNFSLELNGRKINVKIKGAGHNISSVNYDGVSVPSAVVPSKLSDNTKNIVIDMGSRLSPLLSNTNSELVKAGYSKENKILSLRLKSFKGHHNESVITSPFKPVSAAVNGKILWKDPGLQKKNGMYRFLIDFYQSGGKDDLEVRFE